MRALVEGIAEILFLPVLLIGTYFVVVFLAAATDTLP